ncbi:hypothetical protein BHE74_00051954 [Ensete ventricosum]|nr:hypothetical protein BHE74_00051954 [Ensete ventricosum]RZS24135.1 hypothetical protein BHM03_00057168 [Ensete ventricosum]
MNGLPFQYAYGSLSAHSTSAFPSFISFISGTHGFIFVSGLPRDRCIESAQSLQKRRKHGLRLPAPEGPVGEENIHGLIVLAVMEQRRRRRRRVVVGGLHRRHVHAVEYELEVRDAAGIPADELQDAPEGEDVPRQGVAEVLLDVDPAVEHHHVEGSELARPLDHLLRDAGGLPWPQVLVNPPEVFGAGGGGLGGGKVQGSRRRRVGRSLADGRRCCMVRAAQGDGFWLRFRLSFRDLCVKRLWI